jgi:hypothetical protein
VGESLAWFPLDTIEYLAVGNSLAQNMMTILTHLKYGAGKLNLEL